MKSNNFLQELNDSILLGDGAIGTELFARGGTLSHGLERLNILSPDLVQQLHADYVAAGSRVIETNTFAANRLSLSMFGADDKIRDIIFGGVTVARAAAEGKAYVAGSVGPLPTQDGEFITSSDQTALFGEQISLLVESGVDLLMIESFTDAEELVRAVFAARAATDIPIVAQAAYGPDGTTAKNERAEDVAARCIAAGADVVGANCGYGVTSVLQAIRRLCTQSVPLSAYMNAGFPEQVEGRLIYLSTPEYLAKRAVELTALGVRLIGGCCGTGPETIRAIAKAIAPSKSSAFFVSSRIAEPQPAEVQPATPEIGSIIPRRIVVELDPPSDLDIKPILNAALSLRNTGVDAITIADNPLATVRVDTLTTASLVQHESGIPTIPHLTGRDRNRIALQSTIMGAHVLGIRSILCVTGDPVRMHQETNTSGVFDVNSIGLVKMVSDFNCGQRTGCTERTAFAIGVALNPNVRSLNGQLIKLKRKIEAGANFVLTQPIFSIERLDALQDAMAEADIDIPIFLGILPLSSAKNAEFLHNEVPGIFIPDDVREELARHVKVADQRAAALEICSDFIQQIAGRIRGFYMIAPRNRIELVLPLVNTVISVDGKK
jgi:homocysteine S-methyltransferase